MTITDHPHICGKHLQQRNEVLRPDGSSPHMWETRVVIAPNMVSPRIIPTYVGNTRWIARPRLLLTDHPHICGKHWQHQIFTRFSIGSSPHMWETLCGLQVSIERSRIIPTYVGNTLEAKLPAEVMSDHPHICGKHLRPRSSESIQ